MLDMEAVLWYFITIGIPIIGSIILFWVGVWVGCCWNRRRTRKREKRLDAEMGRDLLRAEVETKPTTPYTPPTSDDMTDVTETAPMLPPSTPTTPVPMGSSHTSTHQFGKELHGDLRGGLEMPTPRVPRMALAPSPLGALAHSPSPPPVRTPSLPPGPNEDVTRAINALAEALRQQTVDRPGTPTAGSVREGREGREGRDGATYYRETDAARLDTRLEPLPPLYQSEWRSDTSSTHSVSRTSSERERRERRLVPGGPRRLPRSDAKALLRAASTRSANSV